MSPSIIHGVLLINKPEGPSSFEAVRLVRKAAGMSRVGHAGTLDPLAEGLLTVCLGEACKFVPFLQDSIKRYEVNIVLGVETNTLDREGEITNKQKVPSLDRDTIEEALKHFTGHISQIPPVYSAIKKNGVKLYNHARKGEHISPEPRDVVIEALKLTDFSENILTITVDCRKGTYIRSLARDIAIRLGTVGMVDRLKRVACSGFELSSALYLDSLTKGASVTDYLIPMAEALPDMPKVILDEKMEADVRNGRAVEVPNYPENASHIAMLSQDRRFIAIAVPANTLLRPIRVILEDNQQFHNMC